MSDEPVSLNEARAHKAEDAGLWTPEDCVAAMLRDIRSGELKIDYMAIHYAARRDDGSSEYHGYSAAGCTRPQHIALLAMGMHIKCEEWLK